MFAGNFAPAGWMICAGQLLPISGNDALFNLIGTTYGGDGQQTFALPDLRGRLPIHQAPGYAMAQAGGAEAVTLTSQVYPTHAHTLYASNDSANAATPQNNVGAATLNTLAFIANAPVTPMASQAITVAAGGNQPHDNVQPFLCVNFIISLFGIFPSQS
jgi:microcystin-dependent protein